MPGVFYRKPDPDEPPFFDEGDHIQEGDIVALVGVMKSFHDITADGAGEITEFLVDHEEEVAAGQELVVVEQG